MEKTEKIPYKHMKSLPHPPKIHSNQPAILKRSNYFNKPHSPVSRKISDQLNDTLDNIAEEREGEGGHDDGYQGPSSL